MLLCNDAYRCEGKGWLIENIRITVSSDCCNVFCCDGKVGYGSFRQIVGNKDHFLVRRDESPENYCHSPGVVGGVVVVVVVRRQKL